MTAEINKDRFLQFVASLCLADHMGDVADHVTFMLQELGEEDLASFGDWDELLVMLASRGVQTVYGTSLSEEPDDND